MNFTEMAKIRICQRNGKVKADDHEDPVWCDGHISSTEVKGSTLPVARHGICQ